MIQIKEIATFYFEKFDNSLSNEDKQKIIKFLTYLEKKELKKIPFGLKNPVFEILLGITGSGKTFKVKSNIAKYKDYLIIDPDVFRKTFKKAGRKIPAIIKDILVFYGLANGMNIILQSGEWNEKREFFLYASKYRKEVLKDFLYNGSEYINKVTILSTNPAIAHFSAYYRYYIEEQKFYINVENDDYIFRGMKSIHNFLLKIKNKNHIKPFITNNKYCFEIKGIPLFKVIDNITFIDRHQFIKSFQPQKDEKIIKELFPSFFRATTYREIHVDLIYEEYMKIVKSIKYCQQKQHKDFLKKSLLYLSLLGFSINNYISNSFLLSDNEYSNLINSLNKIKEDCNFQILKKVKVRDSNIKELIENFLKEKDNETFLKKIKRKDF